MSSTKGLTMLNDQDFSRNRFSKNNSSNNRLSSSKLRSSKLSNNKLANQTALAKRVATGVVLGCLLLLAACTQESPSVLGTVERDRLTLTAPVGELITQVNVVEGQQVKAGEVLLTLDSTSANARLALRQAELEQAKAKLSEAVTGARLEDIERAKAVLDGANASVKEAQRAFERTNRLYATKVLSQADLDTARAARDTSLAKQAEAEQSLRLLENGTRSEQLEQAKAAVAAASASVAIEKKALADLSLVAARDAVVDTLPWRVGDRIAAGTQLIGLLASEDPYVRVYLPATWLDRVKAGDSVNILVDGREIPITGTVRNIRSQPAYTPFYALNERDRARLMYLTDITISAAGQDLPTGMALAVEIDVQPKVQQKVKQP
ncbi:HlyD family secretion protein [Shewanella baltica]|uniref:Secretion protein HlyD family protein n=1 Tax=Shewanella baltica (strain OS155 / ATCC BAA-1091) TaxID=325240 RepID=A3D2S5_SHEB5|nr:HlyD family efflux transporter periplasmic adaptor subunit [Shewanella baltica]ABN61038.1 secretion protein HlyD family protein [Shewanella baltica OS155]AEH13385.1 secretion protein HlyD family protein [Shewanella baltica OS117]